MKADSVADVLKKATQGKSRVVSLSLKDRSAVLLAGRYPNACYWFDTKTANFVTSTYYRDTLHPWVAAFNRQRLADTWFNQQWGRMRTDLDYEKLVGTDDAVGEGNGFKQGRAFPHPMNGGLDKPGKKSYEALYNSPFGNDLLLALAISAIDEEKLGCRDWPDMLCLSFSSNDVVGHCWGPDSQEVFDITLRSDRIVAQLLSHLDKKVGKGRYLLALSADHGICPIPEVAKAKGKDAERTSGTKLRARAEAFLDAKFAEPQSKKSPWIHAAANNWVYLNSKRTQENKLAQQRVEQELAQWLRKQPGVQTAYSRQELQALPKENALGQQILRSYFPSRSGDVFALLKPFWLLGEPLDTGTTHGSPYEYDTHVPLLVFGPGVSPGIRTGRISPLATAAIFSKALGIPPPPDADTAAPCGLLEGK
jgi:hypothetical protein